MSSKRAQRRRACTGKIGYQDLDAAVAAAGEVWRRYRDSLNAYRCRFCGRFHLGHPPARVRQAMRS